MVQPILDPARLFYGVPAARLRSAAAAEQSFRVRQQLAAEAAGSFLAVLGLDARLRSTESFIERLEDRLAETEERVAVGSTLEADALKVRLDLESAELDRVRLLESRRVAAFDLGRTVGSLGPVEPLFSGEFDRELDPETDQLVAEANAERPDIRAITEELAALELQARAVRAERWPRLEARLTWQRSGCDPFRPEELADGTLALTWNPFAAGTRAPRIAALDSERAALAADLEELQRGVAVEIRDAVARLATARAAVEVRRRGVELATETLRVERERNAAGRSTTNDLLDAEAGLRRQNTLSELARIDVLRAWVGLELASGRSFL